MKERLINNLALKILAIFLAFFVWLIVSNASNPLMPGSKDVPVDIINEKVLSDSNLTYEVVGKSTVTVNYEVHTLDYYKISSSDFRAYADLSELYDVTGAIPIKIEVVNNASLIRGTPETKNGVLQIKTEKIQRKRFDLHTRTTGETDDGYALGEITLAPDYVYVTGAVSVIGQINSVGIEINIEGANADFSGTAKPIFYDANGNKLNLDDDTTLHTSEITYQVSVLKVKNLGLDFQVEGTVADGYRFTGVESDIKSVSVEGMKSALASLTTLSIPAEYLSLDGATKDQVVRVDLAELLPENITIANAEETMATITLKVEKLEIRGFEILAENVELLGASEEYLYEFNVKSFQVDIQGLREDLDVLKIETLRPSVNVSSLTEGDHKAILTLDLGGGFEMMNYEGFEIHVELVDDPEDDSESNSESKSETKSETKSDTSESKETEKS